MPSYVVRAKPVSNKLVKSHLCYFSVYSSGISSVGFSLQVIRKLRVGYNCIYTNIPPTFRQVIHCRLQVICKNKKYIWRITTK